MGFDTRFTSLVGCRVPIQQAPMGSVSTPELAVAVAMYAGESAGDIHDIASVHQIIESWWPPDSDQ